MQERARLACKSLNRLATEFRRVPKQRKIRNEDDCVYRLLSFDYNLFASQISIRAGDSYTLQLTD
jgi:hypothetical protein